VGRIAGLGLLALLLSACLKLDMDLQVSEDNTVSGSMIFGVDKQLLELTGGSVEDFLGTDSPLPSDAEGVTTEPFEDDEFIGQRFVFDAVPLATLSSGTPDELRITREGDSFTVTGALDLSSGLTGATGASGFPGAEQFLQGADLQIRITFPGPVTDTNGEVDGNTVTWVPVVGERLELRATASAIPSGGDSNLTMLLVIAAVIVVLAVVVGVIVAQRRNRRPAVAASGFGGTASTAPPVAGEPGQPPPPAGPTPPPAGPTPPPPPPSDPV
jgi:hypothetical protein